MDETLDETARRNSRPPVDWSTDAIVARREKFYAASQRAFVPYRKPLILKRGEGQYVWD
jgi:alanine-glyoxylate transaminase/(R)-3-amino-2-methylpropionate-pyruvate transaminase